MGDFFLQLCAVPGDLQQRFQALIHLAGLRRLLAAATAHVLAHESAVDALAPTPDALRSAAATSRPRLENRLFSLADSGIAGIRPGIRRSTE